MTWGSARTALITTRLLCDRFPGVIECLAHECFLWRNCRQPSPLRLSFLLRAYICHKSISERRLSRTVGGSTGKNAPTPGVTISVLAPET